MPKKPANKSFSLILGAVGGLALLAGVLAWARSTPPPEVAPPPPQVTPVTPPAPPRPTSPQPIQTAELRSALQGPDGHLQLARTPEPQATTLVGELQSEISAQLGRTGLPYGAVVLIDPRNGEVLAMAETRDSADPVGAIGDLTRPTVPAASVFKVITTAALLQSGHSPEEKACFHGGLHGLDASHLVERPSDRRCETMTEALARSSNAAFARFALRDLRPGQLRDMAEAFGFNRRLVGDIAVEPSPFEEVNTPMQRARAAAGFEGSRLSPLHAAWLAAVVASDGKVARISAFGSTSSGPEAIQAPAISEETGRALRRMMVQTTEIGTARHAFANRPKSLRGVEIGGKTGSLSAPEGELFRHVSWFVGFAPADHPQVAVAAVAINGWKWKVKAPALARDALATWFDKAGQRTAAWNGTAEPTGGLDAPSGRL